MLQNQFNKKISPNEGRDFGKKMLIYHVNIFVDNLIFALNNVDFTFEMPSYFLLSGIKFPFDIRLSNASFSYISRRIIFNQHFFYETKLLIVRKGTLFTGEIKSDTGKLRN